MLPGRFSLSNISIKHRLPLLIGILLLGIITASTWASYRGVKESALAAGRERLQNLTQHLANSLQESTGILLTRTLAGANDHAIRAYLQSPSSLTRSGASVILQQFTAAHDPNNVQVELWDMNHSLVLSEPDGATPETVDLETEFKQSAHDPFKAAGALRIVKDLVIYPALAAVKDDAGKPIGYLVRWRRVSATPEPRRVRDLLGSEATLYFGNSEGDVWTDLVKAVPKPPASLDSTRAVSHYMRDGNSMMALGRPIGGTPFFIVVEFPDQLFTSQARHFLRRIAMIDLVLLALGLMVAWSLSRSITRPLNLLTGSASKISNGDYSGMVHIRGNDELGALGNAFNSMVATQQASQRDREQKIQELKLMQEAASKVAAIVEFSHDAIVGKTLDGTVTTWNDGAEKLYGYSAAEVVGRSIAILAPSEHAHEVTAILARLKRGDRIDHFETERITKEGKHIFVSLTISPIRDESGAISGWSTIARDITKRKDAEEALQTSEIRYRRLFESAKDGILILNAESGEIIDVNPYLLKMLGYSKEELTGKELWEIGPFKDIVASKLAFAELKERGYIRYENLPLESREGLIRHVEVVSNSYLSGKTRVIQCNIRDITERKQAEAALSASEGRYYTLFEYAPDGIVIADPESYYVDANASMCRMLGYRRDELIGLNASDIVTQTEIPHIGSALNVIKAKADHHREWQFRRKEGSVFAAEVIATMMPDGNLMGMVRDITERKLGEEELLRTNQDLKGALAELQTRTHELASMTQQLWQASKLATMGELAASIAHELNNPLATISLRAELLVGELATDDPNRESLLVIEQEVERMSALVSNLLLFSRRSHQQISTVNIVGELKNSLQFLNYHLRSHGIDVATDFENDLPNIHADTQQLRQVFLNLLTNASDAMPDGGTLTVRAKQQALETGARVVVLEFLDSGVGVEPEDLPKLWEPFFTTKPEGKGTGLGLPICRRAVEEHRGTIDIESLPGKGTTVRIILPATETEIG